MYEATEESTQHGLSTPFGLETPHSYPISQTQNLPKVLIELANELYPTGRAYSIKDGKTISKVHEAINVGFIRLVQDSFFTLDSTLPDNINFSLDDCNLWEYRLGIVSNPNLDIEIRKKAILRKMSFARNIKAGQNKSFIESQLQLAGFDVYVHENKFFEAGEWVYKTPSEILGNIGGNTQYANNVKYGQGVQYGGSTAELIANLSTTSESFAIGTDRLWATFFIGAEVLGEYANVPSSRLKEFKELVLTLKPAHLVAFTFVNYI